MKAWAPIAGILLCAVWTVMAGAHGFYVSSVSIQNYSFTPSSDTILVNDSVRWTNSSTLTHGVVADVGNPGGETWDSGDKSPGGTYTRQFNSVGSFRYHDSQYPDVTGTIVVISASAARQQTWGRLKELYQHGRGGVLRLPFQRIP